MNETHRHRLGGHGLVRQTRAMQLTTREEGGVTSSAEQGDILCSCRRVRQGDSEEAGTSGACGTAEPSGPRAEPRAKALKQSFFSLGTLDTLSG